MTKLDELALRLPTFVAGEEILLSDGQRWTFRVPRVVMTAVPGELGTTLIPRWTFGVPAVDARFDRLMMGLANAQEDPAKFYCDNVVELAIIQLQQNYHLMRHEAYMLVMPREGDTPEEILRLMTRATVATTIRAQELMRVVERTLPYQSTEEYQRLEPRAN